MKTADPREVKTALLDVIRTETALCRYPMHRLARPGTVPIEIREMDANGELALRWEVSHNSKYGQPGPLAYKLDTVIVNRRVERAGRPVPGLLRLGSLNDISRELGLAVSGKNTTDIKRALLQNAFAGITAKIRYRSAEGGERELDSNFTRYEVHFAGEQLPDGSKANAVYLVLGNTYRRILDAALTRPLDHAYLRTLAPIAQRWYELASYRMFAALKHHWSRVRLSYAEFCRYAPPDPVHGVRLDAAADGEGPCPAPAGGLPQRCRVRGDGRPRGSARLDDALHAGAEGSGRVPGVRAERWWADGHRGRAGYARAGAGADRPGTGAGRPGRDGIEGPRTGARFPREPDQVADRARGPAPAEDQGQGRVPRECHPGGLRHEGHRPPDEGRAGGRRRRGPSRETEGADGPRVLGRSDG